MDGSLSVIVPSFHAYGTGDQLHANTITVYDQLELRDHPGLSFKLFLCVQMLRKAFFYTRMFFPWAESVAPLWYQSSESLWYRGASYSFGDCTPDFRISEISGRISWHLYIGFQQFARRSSPLISFSCTGQSQNGITSKVLNWSSRFVCEIFYLAEGILNKPACSFQQWRRSLIRRGRPRDRFVF